MHDDGAQDDVISEDAGLISEAEVEVRRTGDDRDDMQEEQPSESFDGGAEAGRRPIAPPITLKAFLERPPSVQGPAIQRVFEALGRVMEQSIDADTKERRSP